MPALLTEDLEPVLVAVVGVVIVVALVVAVVEVVVGVGIVVVVVVVSLRRKDRIRCCQAFIITVVCVIMKKQRHLNIHKQLVKLALKTPARRRAKEKYIKKRTRKTNKYIMKEERKSEKVVREYKAWPGRRKMRRRMKSKWKQEKQGAEMERRRGKEK